MTDRPPLDWSHLKTTPRSREEVIGQHQVDFCVVGCVDFRFSVKQRHALRGAFGVTQSDIVSIPGGAYAACKPRTEDEARWALWSAHRTVIRHGLALAIEKHHVSHVILSTHELCAMVADDGHVFKTEQEERDFHGERLLETRAWVHEEFPSRKIKVSVVFVHVAGDGMIQTDNLGLNSKSSVYRHSRPASSLS